MPRLWQQSAEESSCASLLPVAAHDSIMLIYSTYFYCCECADGPQNPNIAPACTSCNHPVCSSCKGEEVSITAGRSIIPIEKEQQGEWSMNFIPPSSKHLTKDEEELKAQPTSFTERTSLQPSHHTPKSFESRLSPSAVSDGKQEHEPETPPTTSSRGLDELLNDGREENAILDYCDFGEDYHPASPSPSADGSNVSIKTQTTYYGRTDPEDTDMDILSNSETDYDCSTCAESPSDMENHWTNRIVSPMLRHIVDRIMDGLHFDFDVKSGIITCTSGGSTSESSPSSNSNSNSGQGSYTGGASNAASKRCQSGGDDGDSLSPGGNDENDRRKRPKLNSPSPNNEDSHSPKYACPYFKRNPQRYRPRRACTGPGWEKISRLKEHLYRTHVLDKYICPRCYLSVLDDSQLKEHIRQEPPCDVHQGGPAEGIDSEKMTKLKNKKGISNQSDEERWKAIYRILFPDDDFSNMPSPFYDETDLQAQASHHDDFEKFCRRELPRRVKSKIEIVVKKNTRQFTDELNSEIERIVRECFNTVVSSFRQEHHLDRDRVSEGPGRNNTAYASTPDPAASPVIQGRRSPSAGFVSPALRFNGPPNVQVAIADYEQYAPGMENHFHTSIGLPIGSINPLPTALYQELDSTPQSSPVDYQVPENMSDLQSQINELPSHCASQANTGAIRGTSMASSSRSAPWVEENEGTISLDLYFGGDIHETHEHLSAAFPDIHTTPEVTSQIAESASPNHESVEKYSDLASLLEDEIGTHF
ncbi:hypothetical protein AOQ84DRAFT_439822 [Glonium stellatum]|uniref:Uncharacterized protein n=1 Tax=Glonium stellatum TaxID=574774 RepID=A0A8E2JSK1_9PEZI|nr:hypothetical protein AOQ84DRAFT_439822 [Glonium stellatum]